SPEAVQALVPGVTIPGEASVVVEAEPDRPIRLTAMQGDASLRGALRIDRAAKRIGGVVAGHSVARESLTEGKVKGMGVVVAAGEVAWEHLDVRGAAAVMAIVDGAPGAKLGVAGELVGDRGHAVAVAAAAGDTRALVHADVSRRGAEMTLDGATVVASTGDPKAASPASPVTGAFTATVHANGALRPKLDLALDGNVSGKRVHYAAADEAITAATLTAKLDTATHVPDGPLVKGSLELSGVVRNGAPLGWLAVDGGNRADGKLDLHLHARPASAAMRV